MATDDHVEQNVVEGLGARTISADIFHAMVEGELNNLETALEEISFKNRRFNQK